jgi:hypothetical protein
MQNHIQVAVVVPSLLWLPAAVAEWVEWAKRRLASTGHAPLHPVFGPPVDIVGIHRILWSTLHATAADITRALFLDPLP